MMVAPGSLRNRVAGIYALLFAANGAAWAAAFLVFHDHPVLLGTAAVAYTFGLRHAVDADHIAAIDNVTRKLMQDDERPIAVGLFFSLGHSTVVVAASVAIALTAATIQARFPEFRHVGSIVGTSVSALFLFVIAAINVVVLADVHAAFRQVRKGGRLDTISLNELLNRRGLIGRLFRPLFRLISRSWHMYPLGLLFGLGFDTATEIGLLGISATEAAKGLSVWSILVFPALFTAGMSLADTTDGVLMLGAYGWAYVKPIRKLYYNLNITLVSVLIAFGIGGVEVLSILADKLGLKGGIWDWVGELDFGIIGVGIIAIFALSWGVSTAIYRWKRYDDLPVKRQPRAPAPQG